MWLLDGWECATLYLDVLERIDDELPTVILVKDDRVETWAHPLTDGLAQRLLTRDEDDRGEWLVAMMIAVGCLAAAREEE